MLSIPLTACSSKEADTEDLQDSIDFELDNKTQVEAPTANTPQYSIEDNEEDSLDDLLGSPQTENVSNETSNNNNDVDDILNLLEQTIDPESQENQENTKQSSEAIQEPTVSVSVTGTSETPETSSQQPSQQSTPRKVPNTGIYPD